ncbi:MAG: phenylalanine 4-monooxygenase [Legionellales bacterium]|nr:phenylalanine 4-monooxygenase [Legionellales bacterium]|tara:strand:+ start:6189 stop:7001 length:813 start_codon:yes stop_codon:yes gene_type:complete
MEHVSKYTAKIPDANGMVDFTAEENSVWQDLITRQIPIVERLACDEFIEGLKILDLPMDRIPQCPELNEKLGQATGWAVEPVPALIPVEQFFELLANKKFPAATFIRRREELDYLQEPDIFHEYFGHCPLLTNQAYADFAQAYGEVALNADKEDRQALGRLYWFTVEFGLMNTPKGLKNYGGGILSSKDETIYAVESDTPIRKPLGRGLDALRTPYRVDIIQPVYYVIDDFAQLYDLITNDVFGTIRKARELGEFAPNFEPMGPNFELKC